MAVAIKNVPETQSQVPLSRLAVGSLAGTLYVLGAIGVVFYAIPALWYQGVTPWLTAALNSFVDGALRLVAMAAGAGVLIYLGARLLGPNPPHGIRAGIFFGIVEVLGIALLTQWAGL